jgi:type I restriction enzyme S subunit
MSFPRYPKYKDSGVEWLGEVPDAWQVSRLKHVVANLASGGTPDTSTPRFWAEEEDQGTPWVAIGDMTRESTVRSTEKRISAEGLASKRLEVFPAGTLLYSMFASLGKVATLGVPATVNQAILGITPNESVLSGAYLRYWLGYLESHLGQFSSSNTQDNLNAGKVRGFPVAVPRPSEQVAIATFLDRETAKIDTLIAEQQRLIELLQEKRQAVISHAVTKGLNPDAPMKDSGIEWLGGVPAHWQCVRNKVVFHEVDDRSETEDGELLTVSHITGVTPRSEKDVNMFMAETFVGYKMCRAGDLVINTMWAWMGALGCAKCDGIVSPSYNVYRPRHAELLWPDYYDDLCRVPSHRTAIKARSTGIWESRLRLYPDAFLGMSMPLPPFDEQQAIATFVDRQSLQWDSLAAEAERAINLLQERRSALISAAVTGQIDVRGLAGSEAA